MATAGGGAAAASAGGDASLSFNSQPGSGRGRGDGQHRGRGRGRGGRGRGRGDSNTRGGGGSGNTSSRGRGRGGSGSAGAVDSTTSTAPPAPVPAETATPGSRSAVLRPADAKPAEEGGADGDGDVCFICANPIIHQSIAPCNHITCHICALRMRALYKTKDCPHCRTPAPFVIFTDDPNKRFEEYTDADTTSTDNNIGIRYTNEDIVGDTVLLLRYNCPDESCDFAGLGWPDLHRHVKSVHRKRMCDICTRNKKVFTHEHELFSDKELEKHIRHGDDQPGALDQTGFKGHPLCGFCGERFYDDDKLYEHCRNKHERCFICDRRNSRQPHYYRNYEALEEHFKKDHFLCLDKECLEKKFVVFESEMDLKAHQLEEHANSLSKDVRRDARVVDMSSFDFRQTYQQERRGGGGGGGGGGRHHHDGPREGRSRGRDPNQEAIPMNSAHPMRRDELAFQRQMAIHSAQSVSNRTFGGQLTSSASASSTSAAPSSRPTGTGTGTAPRNAAAAAVQTQPLVDSMESISITDQANLPPAERARLLRHGAVIERASNLLGNDPAKMQTFRSEISSFRTGAVTAPQLMDAFFALFADTSSNALGTLVRELADLFDDKAKGEALRKAWHDWRAINEDYPSLPGLGGMHGATTSTSGWAAAAAASPTTHPAAASTSSQRHTTRVLKLKSSTRRGSGAGLPSSPVSSSIGGPGPQVRSVPGATWMAASSASQRSAPTSSSSSAFPALPGPGSSRSSQPSWIGGATAAAAAAATGQSARVTPSPAPVRRPAASSNEEAFPALPAAPKPLTTIFGYGTGAVRRDVGGRDTGFSWGGGSGASGAAAGGAGAGATSEGEGADGEGGGKGKKKGKQGKKQVLVQWG